MSVSISSLRRLISASMVAIIFLLPHPSFAQKVFYNSAFFAKGLNFSGSILERGKAGVYVPEPFMVMYEVKPEYKFKTKAGFLSFPDDSVKLKKIGTIQALKNKFIFDIDLGLNSEYVAVYGSNSKDFYLTQYYINTKLPGDLAKDGSWFDFNYQVDLQRRSQKSVMVIRKCFYSEKLKRFVGSSKTVRDSSVSRFNGDSALRKTNENAALGGGLESGLGGGKPEGVKTSALDTINSVSSNGKKSGNWLYKRTEKTPKFTGAYQNGEKESSWFSYYVNDSIEVQANFKNNVPNGQFRIYHESGGIKNEVEYNPQKDLFDGYFRSFNDKGTLIQNLNYDDSGNKNGPQLIYYGNGQVALSAYMIQNKLEGDLFLYNTNGNLCSIRKYKQGKLVGEKLVGKANPMASDLVKQVQEGKSEVKARLKGYLNALKVAEQNFDKLLEERNRKLKEADRIIRQQQKSLEAQKLTIFQKNLKVLTQSQLITKQIRFLYFVLLLLVLFLVLLFFIIYSYRKSKSLNQMLFERNTIIEKKNTEILDSIEYAKRIQTAILLPPRIVKEFLSNSFILYLPKDIVAGDFYWMESMENVIYFAACDCTGHGVPGAMVSVVCNTALNRAVNEFGERDPGKVLDKTRELVLENFAKSDEEVNDGMDASLCVLDVEKKKLQWAGANNPLWLVRTIEGQPTLMEIKPDKHAIGRGYDATPFTSHALDLQSGDVRYLFTDGYADQFGGEKGKKLTKARFRDFLLSIAHLPMEEQREKLLAHHDAYRGKLEQVDDICVIGVRV